MATTPQWMLRRLASRTIRVFARHKELEPALAAYETKVGVSAQAFITAYDTARAYAPTPSSVLGEGKGAVASLLRKLRGWAAIVSDDVRGFDRSKFGDKPAVPDDVINDAESFLQLVMEHEQNGGAHLPYFEQLKADIEPAVTAAKEEWDVVGGVLSRQSTLQKEAREAAELFHRHLIAFRRTLRAHLGSTHPDYQKLRASKASAADEDDDEVAAELTPNPAETSDDDNEDDDDDVAIAS